MLTIHSISATKIRHFPAKFGYSIRFIVDRAGTAFTTCALRVPALAGLSVAWDERERANCCGHRLCGFVIDRLLFQFMAETILNSFIL